jgi:predicted RND superfamily exporter protein
MTVKGKLFASRFLVLSFILAVTVFLGSQMVSLKVDPSNQSVFVHDDPDYLFYKAFNQRYGSDEIIVIGLQTNEFFTPENLAVLKDLTERIRAIPYVQKALSLASVVNIVPTGLFGAGVRPLIEGVLEGEKSMEKFRQEVFSNELYRDNLISPDGRTAAIVVRVEKREGDNEYQKFLIERLRGLFGKYRDSRIQFYMTGIPVEQYEFIDYIQRDHETFVPLIVILIAFIALILYQSVMGVLIPMIVVLLTLIWTLGTIRLLGFDLNLVTSLLGPVIMIVSVTNSIHIMNFYRATRGRYSSRYRAIVETMRCLRIPCFLASITTIIGFLALFYNVIPAVKQFGFFAALGTLYGYFITVSLIPVLLPFFKARGAVPLTGRMKFFKRFAVPAMEWTVRKGSAVIVLLSLVLAAGSWFGIRRLQVESNILEFLKKDSRLRIETEFVDENLAGVYPVQVIVRREGARSLVEPEVLKRLDVLKSYLESLPDVTKVISIVSIVKKIHQAQTRGGPENYRIPEGKKRLELYFRAMEKSNYADLWDIISRDFSETILTIRVKSVGTRRGNELRAQLEDYLMKNFPPDYDIRLTGNILLLSKLSDALVTNQMKSLGLASLLIFIFLAGLFRSVRLGLIATLPNILPILMIYGLMGFAGIDLSNVTAMISSVVIGLIVDNTIYFIAHYRREFAAHSNYRHGLHGTYLEVGKSVIASALILMLGFSVGMLGSFKPTIYFAALTSLTIFFSLFSVLFLLPACLEIFKPFGYPVPELVELDDKARKSVTG